MKPKRPLTVTILAASGLIITGFYWVRAFSALNQWPFLESLALSVSPLYLVISGVLLGAAGIPTFLALWSGWFFAPRLTVLYAAAAAAVHWLDWVFLSVSPYARSSLWFDLGLTLFALGFILWALQRKNARLFFKKL